MAFSRPEEETKRVLRALRNQLMSRRSKAEQGIPTTPSSGEVALSISSPGIGNLGRLFDATYVGIEVVLRGGKLAVSGEGGGHGRE